LVGCILPYQISAIALVARALPEQIPAKKLQLRKFRFIRRVGEGMQREFDTVGRILPNQIPVRKGLQQEIKSVGCILPCMFLVGEGEKKKFQKVQNQHGEGIFNPFCSIKPSPDQKKVSPAIREL
jgi:hypothetical protein